MPQIRMFVLLVVVGALGVAVGLMVLRQRDDHADTAAAHSQDALGDRTMLDSAPSRSWFGDRTAVHSSLKRVTKTVRIGPEDRGRSLDAVHTACHGGVVNVEWYVGNLEPTQPDTGIHLSLRMDGETVSSALVGSTRGVWNDQPISIRSVLDCPVGAHDFDLFVDDLTGGWGIPYVQNVGDPENGLVVLRGITVRETWNSGG